MSGGSYNYLCYASDLEDLVGKQQDLQEMVDRLAGLGYAQDAASESLELLLMLRQLQVHIEARMRRLKDVWKAIEWWDSSDYGEDQVKAALAKYREAPDA